MGDDPNSNGGPGFIYVSSDSGTTWIRTSAPSNFWSCVASSGDGAKLMAVGGICCFARVYFSPDFGTSWTILDTPAYNAQHIVCSADASVAAAVIDSWIVTLHSPPPPPAPPLRMPVLRVIPTGSNVVVSWLIPASSFLLQENSDLSTMKWTDVAADPVLNFTNLHYEVNVSRFAGSHFYRLKQQ
jgi:hypothetical protein